LTISTSSSSIIVSGTGAQFTFDFPFVGDSADNISVYYIDADGIQTLLSPSQYTLVLNAAATNQLWGVGGSVTYPLSGSAIAVGTFLQIQRTVPLTQQITVRNQGNYYAQVTEQALDLLEMQIQQVSARTGQNRGVWATDTQYNFGDIVQDGANGDDTQNYYTCIIANESDVWADDLAAGYWSLAINVEQIIEEADAAAASAAAALVSQNAAASSASSASTSASTATTQAGIATTQAAAAAASASSAATYAAALSATSTSSVAIGTGAKTFTTQASKQFITGQILVIASNALASNFMHGSVTSYSGTTLVMNITDIGGSGTYADWNISISGTQGTAGGASAAGSNTQLQYNAAGNLGGAAALTYATSGVHFTATAQASTDNPLLVKGASSQSADLIDVQNSSSASLLSISAAGILKAPVAAVIGGTTAAGEALSVQTALGSGGIEIVNTNTGTNGGVNLRFLSAAVGSGTTNNRNWGIFQNVAAFGDYVIKVSATRGGDPRSGTAALAFDYQGNVTILGNTIIGGGASASELRFLEPSVSGTNYTSFKVQAQAGNITYTLPAADAAGALISNGSGSLSWGSSGQMQLTAFTSSGTFTTSANVNSSTKFKITVTGGGGGGGGGASAQAGPGGGAGGTAIYLVSGLAASTGYTVTIGAGGTAGAGAAGGNGGDSTIVINATTITGGGGVGGVQGTTSGASGGAGGTATNGTINIPGGGGGASGSGSTTLAIPGSGGASFWGGAGAAIISANGTAAGAYGSGGCGAGDDGGGALTSAAGKAGIVTVEWIE